MSQHKYIILDRDGVLNYDSNTFIKNPEEWLVLPRSLEAIALLTKNNYRTLLISNQSGVGRGVITYEDFIGIHNKLISSCSKQGGSIFSTFYCYDHPDNPTDNRKPKPGMYLELADRLNINLSDVFAIGDSPRDMKAALASGCKPLGVKTGNGKRIEDEMPDIDMFDDLFAAVQFVIEYDKQYILNI
tara:strand:+ start:125 stop:685 length:561 start_codon:yes stop_codon:yes gene_type:complete